MKPRSFIYLTFPSALFWLWSINLREFNYDAQFTAEWTTTESLPSSKNEAASRRTLLSPPFHIQDKQKQEEPSQERIFHYVFSTGCSIYQDWQSYNFFFHAHRAGLSHVTRIASGCSSDAAETLRQTHASQVMAMLNPNYSLHLTPDYSTAISGKRYKFFNKPFGLRHWMENGLGFSRHHDGTYSTPPAHENTVFVIMDPDEIILKPFKSDMSLDPIRWHTNPHLSHEIKTGQPFAQFYAMPTKWIGDIQNGLTHVLQALPPDEAASSHLNQWTVEAARQHYIAGPPYIATGPDMYRIVYTWAQIAVPVYELTKDHLSEMFAYITAAAHWNLRHQLAVSFMVSSVMEDREGWEWIDDPSTTESEVCASAYQQPSDSPTIWPEEFPHVLHFCQRYFLGPHYFYKYVLPNVFQCQQPLLTEPPQDIAAMYDAGVTSDGELHPLSLQHRKRQAFMLCHLIARLNEAATFWKQRHCGDNA